MKYLASNLKYLREIKKISQSDLSRQTKITRWRYIRIEEGKHCSIDDLLTLSNFFNLQTDLLLKAELKPGSQMLIEQIEKGHPYKIINGKIEVI